MQRERQIVIKRAPLKPPVIEKEPPNPQLPVDENKEPMKWHNIHAPDKNADQQLIDYMAKYLDAKLVFLTNIHSHRAQIILKNSGSLNIPLRKWELYISSIVPIRTVYKEVSMNLRHVDGSLYKLIPNQRFPLLIPGSYMAITISSHGRLSSRFFHMPNWYVTAIGCKPQILKSTEGESMSHIGPIDTPDKWKRNKNDLRHPYTGWERYKLNNVTVNLGRIVSPILPTPLYMNIDDSVSMEIDSSWVVITPRDLQDEAKYLAGNISLCILLLIFSYCVH